MVRPLVKLTAASVIAVISTQAFASAFQLWEQDAASLGNYHAGYAAAASDASTAFYNPAGITRFHHQQIVFAGVAVTSSVKYRGLVDVSYGPALPSNGPQEVAAAQGGTFAFIPAIHYVTPINDWLGLGFSIDVPFGSKLDYRNSTVLRYISTKTNVSVLDISPVLGIKLTDKASLGIGPDVQIMKGEFNQVGTYLSEEYDSDGLNTAEDTAYGYHVGGLYEFTPDTRVGISYHSQVVHHLTGTSTFAGPFPQTITDQDISSSRAKVSITLPAYTAFSIYHRMDPKWALMASAIYTQWNSLQYLVMQNVAGVVIVGGTVPTSSTDIVVTVPQHFRNTWNLSVGADYYLTDTITLRGALGYDQTPVNNAYRNVQLPDNNRYVVACGGHYQATKAVGVDLGWMHVFFNKAHVAPPQQVTGAEIGMTNGSVTGGADVLGGQITWDIS